MDQSVKVCPACGQPLPQARGKRVCCDCQKPIRRHDKWFIGTDGKLHHKSCENPEDVHGEPIRSATLELLP